MALFPKQIISALDHETALASRDYQAQRSHETVEDWLERLKSKYKLAYPSNHEDSSRKLRLCRQFFSGLRDPAIKKYVKDHLFSMLFTEGRVNDVLQKIMEKQDEMHLIDKIDSNLHVNFVNKNYDKQSQYRQKTPSKDK